ncbi:MAG: hypothetical protein ACI8Y4_005130 [Candidatus Poriferisodalaceae bacterium]|jgi:hypothetical protein
MSGINRVVQRELGEDLVVLGWDVGDSSVI